MNMKQLIYILTLFVTATAFANDYVKDAEPAMLEVHYDRIEYHDSTDHNNGFFKDPVILRISKNKSVFCGFKRLWQDSIMTCDPATFWAMDQARIMSEKGVTKQLPSGYYWSYIYKNIPERKVTECVEATANYRGRTWTAWFAPEIPVQDGPWKLCGLPGLILEAHDANSDYIFEATGLLQNPNSEVGIFTYDDRSGYSTVSRDKFFNNWWRYKHSNFAAKIQAAYGVGSAPANEKPNPVMFDREERDYPHDL